MRFRIGDDLELDLQRMDLRRAGEPVALQPKVFQLLVYLVQNQDRVVSRSELLGALWPGETVVKDVLTSALYTLRRALGDSAEQPRYIRTRPRSGYQLVARVEPVEDAVRPPPGPPARYPVMETRHATFAGRRREVALFTSMLDEPGPRQLLWIHGPPGIGKTTLLHELAHVCRQRGVAQHVLRAEQLGPFPELFVRALADALGTDHVLAAVKQRLASGPPTVLLIDDYHLLASLDEWIREELWASLPDRVRLVLAGRAAPLVRWRSDPGFATGAVVAELAPLSLPEMSELLSARRLKVDDLEGLRRVTKGVPLAIVLWADGYARQGDGAHPLERLDLIEDLVAWFTDTIRSPEELRALEAASMLEETTERSLAALDDPDTAAERLRWLSTLSFVDALADRIRVHALVREAVIARLGHRHPERVGELYERSVRFLLSELDRTTEPGARLRVTRLLMGLGRHHPAVRAAFQAAEGPEHTAEPATGAVLAGLPEVVRRHEGPRAAEIVGRWLAHAGTRAWVVRDPGGAPSAYVMMLRLRTTDASTAAAAGDPVVEGIFRYLQDTGQVHAGAELIVFRTMVAHEAYQTPCPAIRECQTVVSFAYMWHATDVPAVDRVFSVFGEIEVYEPIATTICMERLPDYEAVLDGRRFGLFTLSLRRYPPGVWLQSLGASLVEAARAFGKRDARA